ncbi:type I restriction-modification system, specificity subunit S [Melissococcus plutonius]|uniref:Type I restriction-modification system, specificity subunit S n=1 Tax=Melissococcus plutonius (strain ATCC 35311 / DSM 29964 / CIP 104052 / LMG 20360 / NCIMB 702443) TaxID=940190 RepID=F3YBS3_MELPT
MKNEKYTPRIRFEGFIDTWKQCRLGEVSDIIGGGTPNTNISEYWDGDIDWYSPGEIGSQVFVEGSKKK